MNGYVMSEMQQEPMQDPNSSLVRSSHFSATLEQVVRRLAALLARHRMRVVFAESCTAGLVAASLATVPGISEWLCGSAVTYRDRTKQHWLGVPEALLNDPGAVSEVVARQMAHGVLVHTEEADLAWSITGHLGPDAPGALDGVVFIGAATRERDGIACRDTRRIALCGTSRQARQREAAQLVLQEAVRFLEDELRGDANRC